MYQDSIDDMKHAKTESPNPKAVFNKLKCKKTEYNFQHTQTSNFFDGILENAKTGFYDLILVLHAGVPRLVEKAWAVSGMNRRSPMLIEGDISTSHIINFDKLTVEHARLLIEIYIEKYRLNQDISSALQPFTDEAIEVISEKAELNASAILEKAHLLIEEAAKDKISIIDLEFVKNKLGKSENLNLEESENISKETSQDLFKKSQNQK